MQEPVKEMGVGWSGEATIKQNTMNVPMCKLQTEKTKIDG